MNPERLCEPNRLEVELNRMSRMRLVAGISALSWWVLSDLRRGLWMRPSIAVLFLAFLAVRVILSFKPYGR